MTVLLAVLIHISEVMRSTAFNGSANLWFLGGTRVPSPFAYPPALRRVGCEVSHLAGLSSACGKQFPLLAYLAHSTL